MDIVAAKGLTEDYGSLMRKKCDKAALELTGSSISDRNELCGNTQKN